MKQWLRNAGILAILFAFVQGGAAQAQYGYGWGAWGGGGATPAGQAAQGLGVLAAGAGEYNQQTAVANRINTGSAMMWNEYLYRSNVEQNRKSREKLLRASEKNTAARKKIAERLRNNPAPSDINSGDALNSAYIEINDPRIFGKTLASAKAQIGGQLIRDIPFQYAVEGISTSIHQITQGGAPESLKTQPFEREREQLRALATKIRTKTDAGEAPDRADVDKAIVLVNDAMAKAEKILPRGTKDRDDAVKFLKALRGLLKMMQTPALDFLLAGAEKHPNATVGDLLKFMGAFNLRFGAAKTPRQQQVYAMLYPKLVQLRNEVSPALSESEPPPPSDANAVEFFSNVDTEDPKKPSAPSPEPVKPAVPKKPQ